MSDVFVAQLMLVPYNFPPRGFAFCSGQLMSISQNTALFSLLGTFYGGDGKSTFGLPNLNDSVALNQGQGPGLSDRFIGEVGGSATVTLLASEVPPHNHVVNGEKTATIPTPGGNATGNAAIYTNTTSPLGSLNQAAIPVAGGSQPHNNMMPYQTLQWIIALQGVFPSRQ